MSKKKEKSISVTVDPAAEKVENYNAFLMKTTEDFLEIAFANKIESKEKIEFNVKKTISIPADEMLRFCTYLMNTLQEYEQEFHNKKGIPSDEEMQRQIESMESQEG